MSNVRDDLRERLTDLQWRVTQEDGTEPPFKNEYWNQHDPGIYVDIASGEPLFASLHKFDSGTGWPSFWQPIDEQAVVEHSDGSLGMARVEVRSRGADSHLGHVFDDGPAPTGLRYCINSASLCFVPLAQLEQQGLGRYLPLFGPSPGQPPATKHETAILAGGCFWGMEDLLREIPGVLDTEVGYTGGALEDPTYEDTHDGRSGHAEAVRIVFDPDQLAYETLLEFFFRMHDPTTPNRQGNDVGTQYRSAVFFTSEEQRQAALRVLERTDKSGKWKRPVATEIVAASKFWPAEDYHQDYLEKHPGGYTCHFLRD